MTKTILITGSTDGIGLLTARTLAAEGRRIVLHGRSRARLDAAAQQIEGAETILADLSDMAQVDAMADEILRRFERIDVLINNAGVLKAPQTRTADGLDLRFAVNTLAPYLLTRRLLPIIPKDGRVVNLSSAAQAPVDAAALAGEGALSDMDAYAQSKLAITIWTRELAAELPDGPVLIAVNPGSLLASKMVKDGFGVAGSDLAIGADILRRAALASEFADASGKYFDNDAGRFAKPHSAALNADHSRAVMAAIQKTLAPRG